ncbi:hypothetical protein [Atlanticothrix silvestris]|uniref:hypothetical protein n=1 Tax=Atlanticothrix silvestris TaxID=2840444 RepID=UPI001BDC2E6F|nr:hypothetical protein [Atlanticothrix silvestris]
MGNSEFEYVQEWTLKIQPRNTEPFDAGIIVAPLYDVKRKFTAWRWIIVRDITEIEQSKRAEEQI